MTSFHAQNAASVQRICSNVRQFVIRSTFYILVLIDIIYAAKVEAYFYKSLCTCGTRGRLMPVRNARCHRRLSADVGFIYRPSRRPAYRDVRTLFRFAYLFL